MRTMRLLFAIYLFALSVYPCSDGETCADERKSGSITTVSVEDHSHSSDEVDLCTPFCICVCCAAHIQLSHLSVVVPINLVHNTQVVTFYSQKSLLDNAKAIWQPPKIA